LKVNLTDANAQRFWSKVIALPSGCWEWQSAKSVKGYGLFTLPPKTRRVHKSQRAHRIAYELLIGQVPDGLTLDHLCRNPSCVNPLHLQPVSIRDNILRGNGHTAQNARKTHCPQGHPYDMFNAYQIPSGGRGCRICRTSGHRRLTDRRRSARAIARIPGKEGEHDD